MQCFPTHYSWVVTRDGYWSQRNQMWAGGAGFWGLRCAIPCCGAWLWNLARGWSLIMIYPAPGWINKCSEPKVPLLYDLQILHQWMEKMSAKNPKDGEWCTNIWEAPMITTFKWFECAANTLQYGPNTHSPVLRANPDSKLCASAENVRGGNPLWKGSHDPLIQ